RNARTRPLQFPRSMMNLTAQDGAIARLRVQAISFRQKIVERATICVKRFSFTGIADLKSLALSGAMYPLRKISNLRPSCAKRHRRPKVRQVKPGPRDFHGYAICRVQTEK